VLTRLKKRADEKKIKENVLRGRGDERSSSDQVNRGRIPEEVRGTGPFKGQVVGEGDEKFREP
jgi:hypothetical protein